MRVVSLRAPGDGAPAVELHPRLTVVLGATTGDRLALQTAFRSLVGDQESRLEVLAEVNGVVVRVDATFPDTFATRDTVDPVLVAGATSPARTGDAPALGAGEPADLSALRAEQRTVAGELEVVTRELETRREEAAGAPPDDPPWSGLASALTAALGPRSGPGDPSPAAAPEESSLSHRWGTAAERERVAALEQLLGECREALDAVRRPVDGPDIDPGRIAAVEQVRDEVLALAVTPLRPARRQRHRLEELRATEARLLAELGHPTYVSLLVSLARGGDDAAAGHRAARQEVLEELEGFLLERLEAAAADPQRSSPHAAATERAGARLTEAVRIASALERELRLDTSVMRTPEEVLELADLRLAELRSRSRWSFGGGGDPGVELDRRRRELAARLREVSERLASMERGSSVLAAARSDIPTRSDAPGDLASAVQASRSVSVVGAMPLLVLEAARGGRLVPEGADPGLPGGTPASELPDPLTVAAMSAVTQVVWVTDRPEVAGAVEQLGDLAVIIRI